jgi:Asp-tRNA(Asn)/Glu-tRNA(Gln) amidotransferase A subunit family amidase
VRHGGALILGKTDTVEFAAGGRKALTRNPFNPAHTPGGSSSGSRFSIRARQERTSSSHESLRCRMSEAASAAVS